MGRVKKEIEFTKTIYAFKELVPLLNIGELALFAKACEGKLRVFVRVPDQVQVHSVHQDAVNIHNSDDFFKIRKSQLGAIDELDAAPIPVRSRMPIFGLYLSSADCYEISSKTVVRVYLFSRGFIHTSFYPCTESIDPFYPFYNPNKSLDSKGRRLALYKTDTPIDFSPIYGCMQPVGIDVSMENIYVTLEDVNNYRYPIGSQDILKELCDGGDVVAERPIFFSKKLNYIIDCVETRWRSTKQNDFVKSEPLFDIKAKFSEPAFTSLFGEKSDLLSDKQMSALISFTTSSFQEESVKDEHDLFKAYITPEIKALLEAALLFWGNNTVKLDDVKTHPRREIMVAFFRDHGFKDGYAKFAPTLIRPESASKGRPVVKHEKESEDVKVFKKFKESVLVHR